MIIGNGLIAKKFFNKFNKNNDIIIFASGVSDSTEVRDFEFLKEKKLLEDCMKNNENKKIVYFSSIMTINNLESKYITHKKKLNHYYKITQNHI